MLSGVAKQKCSISLLQYELEDYIMQIGAVSALHQFTQMQRTATQVPPKAAEEAAESPQQEAAEKGRVDVRA